MFQRVLKRLVEPQKRRKEDKISIESCDDKCAEEKRFEESIAQHSHAHGKRQKLSDDIMEGICRNGNGKHPSGGVSATA